MSRKAATQTIQLRQTEFRGQLICFAIIHMKVDMMMAISRRVRK